MLRQLFFSCRGARTLTIPRRNVIASGLRLRSLALRSTSKPRFSGSQHALFSAPLPHLSTISELGCGPWGRAFTSGPAPAPGDIFAEFTEAHLEKMAGGPVGIPIFIAKEKLLAREKEAHTGMFLICRHHTMLSRARGLGTLPPGASGFAPPTGLQLCPLGSDRSARALFSSSPPPGPGAIKDQAFEVQAQGESRLNKPNAELAEAESKLEKAESKLDKAESKLDKAESKLDKARAELDKAESKLDKARADGDAESIRVARAGVNSAQGGVDSAQGGVDSAQGGVDSAQGGVNSAQGLVDAMTKQMARLVECASEAPHPVVWQDPKSFVQTSGSIWNYQPSSSVEKQLGTFLPPHYAKWQRGEDDKNHPLFLVFSGPGTGKSRLLDELPGLAQAAVSAGGDPALAQVIRDAFVFHVSFENGTRPVGSEGSDASLLIGTRMMWQLACKPGIDWGSFWHKQQYTIGDTLTELARITGVPRQNQAVYLLVDGLQELYHTPGNKDTVFASALAEVANVVNAGPEFVVGVIAATVHTPIDTLLQDSRQDRPLLIPPSVDGNAIFATANDPFLRVLVDDMGGHGRALEMLQDAIAEMKEHDYSLVSLVTVLRAKLKAKYGSWFSRASTDLHPLFEAVLARRKFANLSTPISNKSTFAVEDAVRLGLIGWSEEDQLLKAPYILFWLLASSTSKESPLLGWLSSNQPETEEDQLLGRTSVGLQTFAHWEEFVARFRTLKSRVFAGMRIPLADFHAGAKLSVAARGISVHVRQQELVLASHQYPSKSTSAIQEIEHEFGSAQLSEGKVVVLNAPSAPAADVFTAVEVSPKAHPQTRDLVHETFACRLRPNETLNQAAFELECEKAASEKDIFIFFATGRSTVEVTSSPLRVGLVDQACLEAYFGPFAARALTLLNSSPPDINVAPRRVLESVFGIGPTKTAAILEARAVRPFVGLEDAKTRTGLTTACLERLAIPATN